MIVPQVVQRPGSGRIPLLDSVDQAALGSAYIIESMIGEGTYGVVFKAKSRQTEAHVAIKKLRLDGHTEGVPATAIREITLLQDLNNHPNIVRLLQVISEKHRLYLIFELMLEDLRVYTQKKAKMPRALNQKTVLAIPVVKQCTRQMLSALWSCHKHRIVHRDLKPGNVLIDEDAAGNVTVKLADFGLARTYEMPLCTYTNEVVTLWYRAPEILLGERHYTPAVDVWSVGCIVYELLTGRPLFRGDSQVDQLLRIFKEVGTPTETSWSGVTSLREFNSSIPHFPKTNWAQAAMESDPDGTEFLTALLTLNPKQRPSAGEALLSRWLSE